MTWVFAALLASAAFDVAWEAPEGCPPASQLRARIGELSGDLPGPVRLGGEVAVEGPPWRADIRLWSRTGRTERTLTGEECSALAEAVAVIVALALAQAPRVPLAPSPRLTTEDEAAPWQWTVEVAAVGGVGQLPGGLAGGGAARAAVSRAGLRFGLGLTGFLPRGLGEPDELIWTGLWTGELRAGYLAASLGSLDLHPEVLVELGRFEARGLEGRLESASSRSALALAAGLSLALSVPIADPLWLIVRPEVLAALARPAVALAGEMPLFRVEPWSFRLGLGVEFRFR